MNKNMHTGILTGFTEIDQLISGFQASNLIILAARPGMGKTALALNIAWNAAINFRIPVAFFSIEMSKEHLEMRILCAEAGVDSDRLRSGMLDMGDLKKFGDTKDILRGAPIFFDDSADVGIQEIRLKSRKFRRKNNLGLIVVDYLQLVKAQNLSKHGNLELSEISESLKDLAKELNLPVMVLSQLQRRLETRENKRPRLSDLGECGDIEQYADVVILIYRDEVYYPEPENPNDGKAEIFIPKNGSGPIGRVDLAFNKPYARFENLAY